MGQQKHARGSVRAPEAKPNAHTLPGADEARAAALLRVVQQTLVEIHRQPPRGVRVTIDSSLDRDLGLDSLARVELLLANLREMQVKTFLFHAVEPTLAFAGEHS